MAFIPAFNFATSPNQPQKAVAVKVTAANKLKPGVVVHRIGPIPAPNAGSFGNLSNGTPV